MTWSPPTCARSLWADADPDRVGQVVANLIENALKFATTRVEVGAERVGEWIALWVADDGPGVSPADLPHIFERHYTSDRVPTRKLGVGLGLAIVAELAAAMGAAVDAQSPVDDGRGARMVLWLRTARPPTGTTGPTRDHHPRRRRRFPYTPPCRGSAPRRQPRVRS